MIPDLVCSYDFDKHSCVDISSGILGFGVSKLGCISKKNIATFWNNNGC